MHQRVMDYVESIKAQYPDKFINSNVLEVWSQNINWWIRYLFKDCNYTGIDLCERDWVDIVCDINKYYPNKVFDVVISCEMLEHDKQWKNSLLHMYRLTKKWWLMIITCANINRPEHWTINTTPEDSPATTDYYRNISTQDLIELFNWEWIVSEDENKQDTYFIIHK